MLLAEERGFASCSGEAQAAERESTAMRDALERAFLRIDAETLARARAENARDGSCALVTVRIGALTCKHKRFFCCWRACLNCGLLCWRSTFNLGNRSQYHGQTLFGLPADDAQGWSNDQTDDTQSSWLACAGGSLWTAHAGDCRAVLSRGRVAVPLTEGLANPLA